MMEKKESANIILLSHEAANSAVNRLQGFKDTIAQDPHYQVLMELIVKDSWRKSMPLIEDLFESGSPV